MQLCPATVLKCQEAIPISNNEMRKIHRGGEEQPARPVGRKVNVSQSRREVHSAAENRTRAPKAPKSPKPPKEKSKHPILRFIGRTVATVLCLGIMLGSVVAVGIDKALIPILEETLQDYDNVTVINDDILKVDINRLVEEKNGGRPIKVVANLPYYITTPIIMGLFESRVPLKSITIMVQKEVADRMQVGPGTKDYGALSLAVQYYAKPEIVANVPPNCFIPRPNVGSAVIRLTRYEEPPVQVKDEKKMFALIRASFNQRRKTLVNGLGNAGLPGITKESAAAALAQMGLSPTVRGEALTLEQFARLSDLL